MPVLRANFWAPDQAALGNPGMLVAKNCLPGSNGYKPLPSFAALTGALTDYARGAIDVRDKDLNVYQFAGDETNLYQLSGSSWSDISGATYTTGTEEKWEFELYKNILIATNFTDNPQSITLGASSFGNLTTAVKARHVARIDQHLVFCNTYDGTDGNVPDRFWSSAYDDPTDWTPDSTTGSSVRDLGGGPIERLFGGEFGVILCRDRVFRASWVGAPTWFNIDETIKGVGTVAPGACCQLGTDVYTWSQHGFFRIVDGSQPIPIGTDRQLGALVDEYMSEDLDSDYLYRMSCVADPRSGRIFWCYPGAGNTAGQPNKLIIYDSKQNRWSFAEVELDMVWRAGGIGFTLEQLDNISSDIDDFPASLDSSAWKGDATLTLAAFDSSRAHGFFSDTPMAATFVSAEQEFYEDRHSLHLRHTPMLDQGTVVGRVGYRDTLRETVAWTQDISENRTGRLAKRVRGRYHRLEARASGDWEDFIGWLVSKDDVRPLGRVG